MELREFVIMKNYTSGYHPSSNSTNGGITASTDDGNLQLSSVVLVLGTVLPLLIIVFLVYVWSGSVPEKLTCGRRTSQNVQSTEDKIPLIHADDDCNSR